MSSDTVMKSFVLSALLFSAAQAQTPSTDAWGNLAFLKGTWEAKTAVGGDAGASATGDYTFREELGGHILARHGNLDSCRAPAGFDCDHGDLLYIYRDAPGQPLKAIYFDNEGHTIHYTVTTAAPATAVFLSDAAIPGPRFRLWYELKDGIMSGKFQMQVPGQTEWKSYLEWSGRRKP